MDDSLFTTKFTAERRARVLSHKPPLIERFIRYARVGTAADPSSETSPSSARQLILGEMLTAELTALGAQDVIQDSHGLVWGTIPASHRELDASPIVLLNSHIDTSPEAPSDSVNPTVIESYQGGKIVLKAGDEVIDPAMCEELLKLKGATLITTDGTTLLGGDDKAGLTAIMRVVELLIQKGVRHGPVRILFTCDEEIGKGTRHIDWDKLAFPLSDGKLVRPTVAYTLDGGDQGQIDEETFSADRATITFVGSNIHPAIAKGRMINALRAAAMFVDLLPRERLSPESTEGREGFVHPHDLHAGVGEAKLQMILRDFDAEKLTEYRKLLEDVAEEVKKRIEGIEILIETSVQYRNMVTGLQKLPQAVDLAMQAYERIGIVARKTIVRGGTDGSMLTAMGLPTPNLSVGQHNIHSVREFVCVDQMAIAVEHLIELLALWAEAKS